MKHPLHISIDNLRKASLFYAELAKRNNDNHSHKVFLSMHHGFGLNHSKRGLSYEHRSTPEYYRVCPNDLSIEKGTIIHEWAHQLAIYLPSISYKMLKTISADENVYLLDSPDLIPGHLGFRVSRYERYAYQNPNKSSHPLLIDDTDLKHTDYRTLNQIMASLNSHWKKHYFSLFKDSLAILNQQKQSSSTVNSATLYFLDQLAILLKKIKQSEDPEHQCILTELSFSIISMLITLKRPEVDLEHIECRIQKYHSKVLQLETPPTFSHLHKSFMGGFTKVISIITDIYPPMHSKPRCNFNLIVDRRSYYEIHIVLSEMFSSIKEYIVDGTILKDYLTTYCKESEFKFETTFHLSNTFNNKNNPLVLVDNDCPLIIIWSPIYAPSKNSEIVLPLPLYRYLQNCHNRSTENPIYLIIDSTAHYFTRTKLINSHWYSLINKGQLIVCCLESLNKSNFGLDLASFGFSSWLVNENHHPELRQRIQELSFRPKAWDISINTLDMYLDHIDLLQMHLNLIYSNSIKTQQLVPIFTQINISCPFDEYSELTSSIVWPFIVIRRKSHNTKHFELISHWLFNNMRYRIGYGFYQASYDFIDSDNIRIYLGYDESSKKLIQSFLQWAKFIDQININKNHIINCDIDRTIYTHNRIGNQLKQLVHPFNWVYIYRTGKDFILQPYRPISRFSKPIIISTQNSIDLYNLTKSFINLSFYTYFISQLNLPNLNHMVDNAKMIYRNFTEIFFKVKPIIHVYKRSFINNYRNTLKYIRAIKHQRAIRNKASIIPKVFKINYHLVITFIRNCLCIKLNIKRQIGEKSSFFGNRALLRIKDRREQTKSEIIEARLTFN